MWRCPTCGRGFRRVGQAHSCRVVDLDEHFRNKPEARALFDQLLTTVTHAIGPCEVLPLACCIHLSEGSDFLAVLPKRNRLEVRFALPDELDDPRVLRATRISSAAIKHSVDVVSAGDIDDELLSWIREAHRLAVP